MAAGCVAEGGALAPPHEGHANRPGPSRPRRPRGRARAACASRLQSARPEGARGRRPRAYGRAPAGGDARDAERDAALERAVARAHRALQRCAVELLAHRQARRSVRRDDHHARRRAFGPARAPRPPRGAAGSARASSSTRASSSPTTTSSREAERITVQLEDGRAFPGKVVGRDPRRTSRSSARGAGELLPLPFGDSDGLEVGDWVVHRQPVRALAHGERRHREREGPHAGRRPLDRPATTIFSRPTPPSTPATRAARC